MRLLDIDQNSSLSSHLNGSICRYGVCNAGTLARNQEINTLNEEGYRNNTQCNSTPFQLFDFVSDPPGRSSFFCICTAYRKYPFNDTDCDGLLEFKERRSAFRFRLKKSPIRTGDIAISTLNSWVTL